MRKSRLFGFAVIGFWTLATTAMAMGSKAKAPNYPSHNISPQAPDSSGMPSSAAALAAHMRLGWNLGDSLEATGGETEWFNPKVTPGLIKLVKDHGFNAIRIPASWDQYVENTSTAKIKDSWLDRVEEVVRYCVDEDLFVLLNIHWDGGWLENNCVPEKQAANNAKQKAFWEQIATRFRGYGERLMFAGSNEPNVKNASQMRVLNSYHQTFVDAVRSTGGRNHYRVLVVQGPNTDIKMTRELMKKLPRDVVPDRLMVEIHYYTPWNFCGLAKDEPWGKMSYFWGKGHHWNAMPERNADSGEEEELKKLMAMMRRQWVDRGVPVILGEYGAMRRTNLNGEALKRHNASRVYYNEMVTREALANGLIPFYWDNGHFEMGSALFDRKKNRAADSAALEALKRAAN